MADIRASADYRVTDKVQGFVGVAVVYHNGKRVWSENTGIYRYTHADAMIDARRLATELAESGVTPAV